MSSMILRFQLKTLTLLPLLALAACSHNAVQKGPQPEPASSAVETPHKAQPPRIPSKTADKPSKPANSKKASKTRPVKNKQPATAAKPRPAKRAPSYPPVALGRPVEVKFGHKRSIPGSNVWFKVSNISDQRCPLEMQCNRNGGAVVTLALYDADHQIGLVKVGTDVVQPNNRNAISNSYHFKLVNLLPYPTVQFIEPRRYVAELIVHKK